MTHKASAAAVLETILVMCDKQRIQLRDEHHHVLLLEGVVEIEDLLVVQLRQQVHLSESRGLPLASCGNELGSKLGLSLFLSHPLHIGEGSPAPNSAPFWVQCI